MATTLFLLATVGNAFSPSVVVYIIIRFFIAAGGMGAYLIAYVLGKFVGKLTDEIPRINVYRIVLKPLQISILQQK